MKTKISELEVGDVLAVEFNTFEECVVVHVDRFAALVRTENGTTIAIYNKKNPDFWDHNERQWYYLRPRRRTLFEIISGWFKK